MNKGIGGIIADYGKDDSFTRIAPTERMLEKNTGTQGATRLPSCDTPRKVRAPASHRDSALRHHQRRPPSRPPHNRNPDVLIETILEEGLELHERVEDVTLGGLRQVSYPQLDHMIPVGVTLPCERAYVKLLRSDLARACGQLDDLVPVALDDPLLMYAHMPTRRCDDPLPGHEGGADDGGVGLCEAKDEHPT